MGRKIFVSFLGKGDYTNETYQSWRSEDSSVATKTPYVQKAILELMPHSDIDTIVFLITNESEEKNYTPLLKSLEEIGVDTSKIVTEKISSRQDKLDDAWKWFETLQSEFDYGDTLILDVTQGFRLVPIIFSAAIGYLKRVKDITVEAVLYGAAFDETSEVKPIVNLRDFYTINDWSEAVGRLVDTADSRLLAKTARQEKDQKSSFAGLNNDVLLETITALTSAFRNVETQQIGEKAKESVKLIDNYLAQKKHNTLEGEILLLIRNKFKPLSDVAPDSKEYCYTYLELHCRVIEMLAEHKLYMQCFTAMREWFGSLGCFLMKEEKTYQSNNEDNSARSYAEIFIQMLSRNKQTWKFNRTYTQSVKKLLPGYTVLSKIISPEDTQNQVKGITDIRNGFDHAWTGRNRQGIVLDLATEAQKGITFIRNILVHFEHE